MYHCDKCGCAVAWGGSCGICSSAKDSEPEAVEKAPLIVPRAYGEGRSRDPLHAPSFAFGFFCGAVAFAFLYLVKLLVA